MYGGWRGRIGYIGPCPGEHELMEFYQIAPPGVSLVATGLSVQEIEANTLEAALAQPLARAIRDMDEYDVSAIILAGEPMVFLKGYGSEARLNAIASGITQRPFTHNLPCVVEALRTLNVKRLALATPYSVRDHDGTDVTQQRWGAYFEEAGIELAAFEGLALPTNRDVARLSVHEPYRLGAKVLREARVAPDALYMPCAAWRAPMNIAKLERDFGIPVICSVQAWTWKAMQLIGVREVRPGFGKLFEGWHKTDQISG